jgi:uncharacterized protein (DUF58 family)
MTDGREDGFTVRLLAPPAQVLWARQAIRLTLPYPALLLVAASPFGGVETAVVSSAIAVVYAALALAKWRPGRLLAALFASLTMPYILYPLTGFTGLLSVLPVLPLMFDALSHNAVPGNEARRSPSPTPLASSLALALAGVGLFAAFVSSEVLLASCGVVALALGLAVLVSARGLARERLQVAAEPVTAIAGRPVKTRVKVRTSTGMWGWGRVRDSGIASQVTPGVFRVGAEPAELDVDVTPLLSGPTQVLLGVVIIDRWGLVAVSRAVAAVSLEVVPRTRGAERVARLFLQGAGGSGGLTGADLSDVVRRFLSGMRGVEYLSSRLYAAGDGLHDIDWKHTARLERLTTKEYAQDASSSGIIAVSLLASNADEADRLAFELLSAALAVARLAFSARLISYGRTECEVTASLGDRALVRKSLEVIRRIVVAPVPRRVLRVAGLQNVAGARARLEGASSPAAARMRDLLGLEERAVRRVVESSPLTAALARTRRQAVSGWFVAISTLGYDGEALATQLHAMEAKGMRTLLVNASSPPR